jgi:hypothetical protein
MTPAADTDEARFGPWDPGIQSQIPADLLQLATLFRPEHARTALRDVRELHDLTDLPLAELVAFRPERLALHELLIRVTANVSVPDGTKIEDLGINFRRMTRTLLERHVEPRMPAIVAAYESTRKVLAEPIERELDRLWRTRQTPGTPPPPMGWWQRLVGSPQVTVLAENPDAPALIAEWEARARTGSDAVERTAARALARVIATLLAKHGSIWGDRDVIARVVIDLAANALGSEVIGELLEPIVTEGATQEGYRLLPPQTHPVVMNTKGPSAAGKSTMRPLQKRLAGRIGVDWSEFALISPDIWRKQLLDYGGLGASYKYAGAFTGEELAVIDAKLDTYMARKAERGDIPHLLIDRFRFDSFAPDSDVAGSNLLTRFGRIVYLFFLVTPPHLLVDRAWNRGLDVGRYKAVDDTLAHAVEAYAGMPELFFTWIRHRDKRVHFEFLDNTVARGDPPRTAAFGWNDVLNVLDVGLLLDIERYRKIDVNALVADALYAERAHLAPQHNCGFLKRCLAEFREVNFVEQDSGRVYLRVLSGVPAWADPNAMARALAQPDTRAALTLVLPHALAAPPAADGGTFLAEDEHVHTVGAWGAPPRSC